MKFKQFLEMPIGTAKLIGKGWDKFPSNQSMHQNWDKASHNILTNNGLERIRNAWNKVPQTFDMYFLKTNGMRSTVETGEVDQEYLKNRLRVDIPVNRNNITIIFTNNIGGDRIPMTPWIVGHRFAHAIRFLESYQKFTKMVRRDFEGLLDDIYGKKKISYDFNPEYEKLMKQIMMAFGSMRSAKTGSLSNVGEFAHELFGQYIISGEIKFRTDIPLRLTTSYAWGYPNDGVFSKIQNDEPMLDNVKDRLEANANYYGVECDRILNNCVGRIFVM